MSILRIVERFLHHSSETPERRLLEIPEIKKVLTTIATEKFGLMNQIAREVAHKIYAQMQVAGMYSEVGAGTFRNTGKAEELVAGSQLCTLIHDFADLSQQLACCQLAPKGTVLLNTLSIYLGMAIIADKNLKQYKGRRSLLLGKLHVQRLPIGLYVCGTGEMCTPETIRSVVLFDVQGTQVDISAYTVLVERLRRLLQKHTDDTEIQNWCKLKLRELEIFGQCLSLQGQGFKLNQERLHVWQK